MTNESRRRDAGREKIDTDLKEEEEEEVEDGVLRLCEFLIYGISFGAEARGSRWLACAGRW